jgi:hypothetical protein
LRHGAKFFGFPHPLAAGSGQPREDIRRGRMVNSFLIVSVASYLMLMERESGSYRHQSRQNTDGAALRDVLA